MKSGLGDQRFLPGYALLLPDPVVPSLNDLDLDQRTEYLLDMAELGDALLAATVARRINYSIYGNHDPTLQSHLCPRYEWEPEEYQSGPAWLCLEEQRSSAPFDVQRHKQLLRRIRGQLG